MEQAIKKAVLAGYVLDTEFFKYDGFGTKHVAYFLKNQHSQSKWYSEILFDPLFWQALGKAEGWRDKDNSRNKFWTSQKEGNKITLLDEWENQCHNFIDHLITSKPIDTFFEELLK